MAKKDKKQAEQALRYNDGKISLSLVPPSWPRRPAEIFEPGAKKYAAHTWKKSLNTKDHQKFIDDRLDSLLRHLDDHRSRILYDPETGCLHIIQVGWNAFAIAWYMLFEGAEA